MNDFEAEAIRRRLQELNRNVAPDEARAEMDRINNPNVFERVEYEEMPFIDKVKKRLSDSANYVHLAQSDPDSPYNAQNATDFAGSIGKAAAQKILAKVNTPEMAVALKGKARQKYLEALDAVYGPQGQRAADMGFGYKTYYHGTESSIDEFNPAFSRRDGSIAGFFTQNTPLANEFATGAHVGPDEIRNAREFNQNYNPGDGGNVLPVRLKEGFVFDAERKPDRQLIGEYISGNKLNKLKSLAADKQDNWSEVEEILFDINKLEPEYVAVRESGQKNLAALKPENIRSKFAAFDPRFKKSSKIMAGTAGGLLGGRLLENELNDE